MHDRIGDSANFGHDAGRENEARRFSPARFPFLRSDAPAPAAALEAVMNLCRIAPVLFFAAALAGCGGTDEKPSIGSVAGSLTGGLIGGKGGRAHKAPSPEAAALYEAWAASELGRRLDDRDRVIAAETEFDALENGAPGTARGWHNPATGRRGMVTPGAAYSVNQYTCRDFVDAVGFEERQEIHRATACRQPDGSWRPLG
jgi:surface antigen